MLTVVLLASIGATSIIGTLIPQNESPGSYLQAFGDFFYRFFLVFDLFDMYHSWWFQFLILLLTLNIIVCSIDRLSSVWKIVFDKEHRFHISRFRNSADKMEFTDKRPAGELENIFTPVVTRGFGYHKVEKTEEGFRILAEKWRWTRLGVYIVHLSILFLLVGALIGSLYGFDGYVNIPEGGEINSVEVRNSPQPQKLGFTVRCDKFTVSYYASGAPKEYKSSLTVLESGKPVLHRDIVVNSPLRYKGINFFQSSFGPLPPGRATDLKARYYTGLQVTKDPGVWVVYTGFILMIIGCFITFFMSHQRICVEVINGRKRNKVMVAGISNKNKLGMQNKITWLYNKLNEKEK